jgi:cobalt/nickel transport system permease protein
MLLSPAQMHIPDGFLSVLVSAIMWLLTVIVVGYALKRAGKDLDERQVPLMGVLAAAIFAGQMLNFTVAGGTSGHLMGAAIATILLGPWPAVLVMTCVVAVQALIFQDGGLLVLGANIFNMGIIGVSVAYTTYRIARKLAGGRRWGIFAAGFIAAWLSIVVTSLAVALQLALSGTSPANIAIPAMGGIHALIGVGEGLITFGALAFITATRPDLLKLEGEAPKAGNLVWAVGLLLTLVMVILSPLASANPDGLERVAEQQGFLSSSEAPLYSIIPDYLLPGITNEALATIIAGFIGVLIIFIVVLSAAFLRRKGRQLQ